MDENPIIKAMFAASFKEVQKEIHKIAIDKGCCDAEHSDEELIAHMHSELSEVLEAMHEPIGNDEQIPQFLDIEVKLANVLIRIMEFAERRDFRIAEALWAKAMFDKNKDLEKVQEENYLNTDTVCC